LTGIIIAFCFNDPCHEDRSEQLQQPEKYEENKSNKMFNYHVLCTKCTTTAFRYYANNKYQRR